MSLRQSPPVIAQLFATLAVLAGIFVAMGIVTLSLTTGGGRDFETPWWTGILRFCTIFLLYSIPALAHHLTHQFFCWAFKGSGYSTRYPRLHFRRLLLCIFATITIASNVLFWAMMVDQAWIPPELESILGFGIIQSPIILACVTATLFPDSRKSFWWGMVFVAAAIASLILQRILPIAAGYNFIARFLNQ